MHYEQAEAFITELLHNELPAGLHYHNLEHTKDVLDSALRLADLEGVQDDTDRIRLKTAALFHDCGFTVSYDRHEEEGCVLAETHLPGFGYSAEDIRVIVGMILATRVPQKPRTHLEKILCDADLDYLGRDDFLSTGRKLLEEWRARGQAISEAEWNRLQADFLSSHRYWTDAAVSLREKKKQEHLREVNGSR